VGAKGQNANEETLVGQGGQRTDRMVMRVTKANLVLGLYGPSCVGKSTLAKEIGKRLGANVRHCGEILKEKSSKLKIPFDPFPIELSRAVDAETRTFAENANEVRVIEGRYLNIVLFGIPNVRLLRLTCSAIVRDARLRNQVKEVRKKVSIVEQDSSDEHLSKVLYGDSPPMQHDWMVLDTTECSTEVSTEIVLKRLLWEARID
jgi:cytidylate kinase